MSPTRRDILKTIAALGAASIPTTVPTVAAREILKPAHEFDDEAIRFDARELIDAYCPEHLEGMIVVQDHHTGLGYDAKIELFSDGFERTEIRLTDVLDKDKSIVIGSTFACQYRLMVALAGLT